MEEHNIMLLLLHFFLAWVLLGHGIGHLCLLVISASCTEQWAWNWRTFCSQSIWGRVSVLVVSAARLTSSELSKAEFPSLGQWNGLSPRGLARTDKGNVSVSLPCVRMVVTGSWAWEIPSSDGTEPSLEISSPDTVEALGAMLVWEKETVSRDGLGKQTTVQQNKNTKENPLFLCDLSITEQRIGYWSRNWEQELLEKVRRFIGELRMRNWGGQERPVQFCYDFQTEVEIWVTDCYQCNCQNPLRCVFSCFFKFHFLIFKFCFGYPAVLLYFALT